MWRLPTLECWNYFGSIPTAINWIDIQWHERSTDFQQAWLTIRLPSDGPSGRGSSKDRLLGRATRTMGVVRGSFWTKECPFLLSTTNGQGIFRADVRPMLYWWHCNMECNVWGAFGTPIGSVCQIEGCPTQSASWKMPVRSGFHWLSGTSCIYSRTQSPDREARWCTQLVGSNGHFESEERLRAIQLLSQVCGWIQQDSLPFEWSPEEGESMEMGRRTNYRFCRT